MTKQEIQTRTDIQNSSFHPACKSRDSITVIPNAGQDKHALAQVKSTQALTSFGLLFAEPKLNTTSPSTILRNCPQSMQWSLFRAPMTLIPTPTLVLHRRMICTPGPTFTPRLFVLLPRLQSGFDLVAVAFCQVR